MVPDTHSWVIPAFVALNCAGLALLFFRRPVAATVAVAAGVSAVGLAGQSDSLTGLLNVLSYTLLLVAFALGAESSLTAGVAGVVLLAVALQTTSQAFNPLFEMITAGPWLAGRLVQSRRRLARQIADRNEELEAERERYVHESARHEQARIARDLHDVVGHCLSLIVVQSAAAQRLVDPDPDGAAEAVAAIVAAAAEAETEIGVLGAHLDGAGRVRGAGDVGELVRLTAATGVPVRYAPEGDLATVDAEIWETVYRVVQESLTNSIKHAPGAAVEVGVRRVAGWLQVEVAGGAAPRNGSGLDRVGGGRGLEGMPRRVQECGGTLTAGPADDGGWRVSAELPADPTRLAQPSTR